MPHAKNPTLSASHLIPRHLLTRNAPPSSSEVLQIRDLVSSLNSNLTSMDAEIAAAQARLTALQQARDEELQTKAYCFGILSTLRNLPPEIVAEIFSYVVCNPAEAPVFVPIHAVVSLGHICSGWRRVAYSTPRLWASLSITRRVPDLARWLKLSGTVGLSLEILAGQGDDSEDETSQAAYARSLLLAIRPHMQRIREFRLDIDSASMAQFAPVLDAPAASWDTLTHLEICTRSSLDTGIRMTSSSAPLLVSVMIKGSRSTMQLNTLSLPWEQLSRLTVDQVVQVNDVFYALRCCPNLSVASFFCATSPDNVVPEHLTHPSLRSLLLHGDIVPVIERLTLPALQTLWIGTLSCECFLPDTYTYTQADDEEFIEFPADSVSRLIQRSRCTLETLVLCQFWIDEDPFLMCLSAMPALRILSMHTLQTCEFNNNVLEGLTRHSTDLLPKLEELVLEVGMGQLSCRALADFAAARRTTTTAENVSLRRVELAVQRSVDEDLAAATLVGLANEGLEFTHFAVMGAHERAANSDYHIMV